MQINLLPKHSHINLNLFFYLEQCFSKTFYIDSIQFSNFPAQIGDFSFKIEKLKEGKKIENENETKQNCKKKKIKTKMGYHGSV